MLSDKKIFDKLSNDLRSFEPEYDPSAWERLNKSMISNSQSTSAKFLENKFSSSLKSGLIGGTLIISIVGFFLYQYLSIPQELLSIRSNNDVNQDPTYNLNYIAKKDSIKELVNKNYFVLDTIIVKKESPQLVSNSRKPEESNETISSITKNQSIKTNNILLSKSNKIIGRNIFKSSLGIKPVISHLRLNKLFEKYLKNKKSYGSIHFPDWWNKSDAGSKIDSNYVQPKSTGVFSISFAPLSFSDVNKKLFLNYFNNIGLIYKTPKLKGKFFLQSGIIFNRQQISIYSKYFSENFEEIFEENKIKMEYLNIPINLGYYKKISDKSGVTIQGGLSNLILLKEANSYTIIVNDNVSHILENQFTKNRTKLAAFLNLELGIEHDISKSVSLGISTLYQHPIRKLGNFDLNIKNIGMSINLNYRIKKFPALSKN